MTVSLWKCSDYARERIIEVNRKTIRSSIDTLNYLTNTKLAAEARGLANIWSTAPMWVLQSSFNDIYCMTDGATYGLPGIFIYKYFNANSTQLILFIFR